MRTEITKSHLNNHICQHRGMKTSTVTPSFYFVFNISLYCYDTIPNFIGNLWRVLLPGNHLNYIINQIIQGLKKVLSSRPRQIDFPARQVAFQFYLSKRQGPNKLSASEIKTKQTKTSPGQVKCSRLSCLYYSNYVGHPRKTYLVSF